MLELMIGIFLICICVFPLVQLPTNALKEETKTAFRIQMHRHADLAFAQIKELLYRQEISWDNLSRPAKDKATPINDKITIAFKPLGSREFHRSVLLHSVGKKNQNGEEWRLVTVKVKFRPLFFNKGESKASRIFTYQILVKRAQHLPSEPKNVAPS